MIIRLTLQHAGPGLRATITKREEEGKSPTGQLEIFVVDKEEAKNERRSWRAIWG